MNTFFKILGTVVGLIFLILSILKIYRHRSSLYRPKNYFWLVLIFVMILPVILVMPLTQFIAPVAYSILIFHPLCLIITCILMGKIIARSGSRFTLALAFWYFLLLIELGRIYVMGGLLYRVGDGLAGLALIPGIIALCASPVLLLVVVVIFSSFSKRKRMQITDTDAAVRFRDEDKKRGQRYKKYLIAFGIIFVLIIAIVVGRLIFLRNFSSSSKTCINGCPLTYEKYVAWTESKELFGEEEVFLYNLETGIKKEISQESVNVSDLRLFQDENKVIWFGSQQGRDDERSRAVYIYDILTEEIIKFNIVNPLDYNKYLVQNNQSGALSISGIANSYIYKNYIVFRVAAENGGISPQKVVLYNLNNNILEEITGTMEYGRNGGTLCFKGDKNKIILEDLIEGEQKLILLDLDSGKKIFLPRAVNDSVMCPQISGDLILFAQAENPASVKRPNYSSDPAYEEFRFNTEETKVRFMVFDLTDESVTSLQYIKKPLFPLGQRWLTIYIRGFRGKEIKYLKEVPVSGNIGGDVMGYSRQCYNLDILDKSNKEKPLYCFGEMGL